jgi:dipeptidyl aminopeptidase/acylaminoacyl peptidase
MHSLPCRAAVVAVLTLVLLAPGLGAQGTIADYERASTINQRLGGMILGQPSAPTWLGEANRFWYRVTVDGGNEWRLVDAAAGAQHPLFDHGRLAEVLSQATGEAYAPADLPFVSAAARFEVTDDATEIRFVREGIRWSCSLAAYTCEQGERVRAPSPAGEREAPVVSPDGRWEAFIRDHNVAIRPADGGEGEVVQLSRDGSDGNYYTLRSIRWSPDSRKLVAYRRVPGHERVVHFVRSSPPDRVQPVLETTRTLGSATGEDAWGAHYRKPGDRVPHDQPVLFDVETRGQAVIDRSLFPDPYSLQSPAWREDSRAFTFEYNERGHRNYRVIEVDGATGAARAIIDESPSTFFDYSGARWRHDIEATNEILWRSERDGWKHIWLYDARTGRVKNQVTRGEYVVRAVQRVDEENRHIYFSASGMDRDQDPYFVHFYRIGFDGRGLVRYTEANGNHTLSWSPDNEYYVAAWSRVDHPPVAELRRTADRSLVLELSRTDISRLQQAGWHAPEPFVAKARDGRTDIWGVIIRPANFDPSRRYPVIENIYAGPQGSFVPKNFGLQGGMLALAELGFIVVQIDGMGTANRSKAFHDVAWRNLGDAGFPDRILWHQAVAERYPWYDLSRVGIYGGSAGGQNALGGLLFHPDFYHAGVAANGCHDNRMDKIWWNELWMSWPVGSHYEEASNVVHAHRLQGNLLLVVGELDDNVDPSSSLQVADALIRADKDFDLLFIPNAGHGSGGAYGTRKRNDFFVRNLLGVEPPAWNRIEADRDGTHAEISLHDDPRAWMAPPASELAPSVDAW